MSYGLQVWNSSGQLILDVSDRLSRFIQSVTVTLAPGASITVPITGYTTDGTWFVYATSYIYVTIVEVNNGIYLKNSSQTNQTITTTIYIFRG